MKPFEGIPQEYLRVATSAEKTFSQIISSKINLSFKLEASNFIKNNF